MTLRTLHKTPNTVSKSHLQKHLAHTQQLGQLGELMAARYLEMRGYRILQRNWRSHNGELDLIVTKDELVIAVEVKTRAGLHFGHPFESISPTKVRRMRGLLAAWCVEQRRPYLSLRLDAIAIVREPGKAATIEHLRGIE